MMAREEIIQFNDAVLSNFRQSLQTAKFASGAPVIIQWLDKTIKELTEEYQDENQAKSIVVNALEDAEDAGVVVKNETLYDYDSAIRYTEDLSNFLYQNGFIDKEEALRILSELNEEKEYNSNFFDMYYGE